MPKVRLRPVVLVCVAISIAAAGSIPPVILFGTIINRHEADPTIWLFAFSFSASTVMVAFLYLVRVKGAFVEFRNEARERELSWEIFQRGYIGRDAIYDVVRDWSGIALPHKRKLLLVRAGILPGDSLKDETLALSDDSLRVMSSLAFNEQMFKS